MKMVVDLIIKHYIQDNDARESLMRFMCKHSQIWAWQLFFQDRFCKW